MGEKLFSFGKQTLDLQALQLSRREFLRYSLLFGSASTFLAAFPPNRVRAVEQTSSPESNTIFQELDLVASVWRTFDLDTFLQQATEAARFFGKELTEYQLPFQTIDFFGGIQELVEAYEASPAAAISVFKTRSPAQQLAFSQVIVPMFAVLALHQAVPIDRREAVVAAAYAGQRPTDITLDEGLLESDEALLAVSLGQLQNVIPGMSAVATAVRIRSQDENRWSFNMPSGELLVDTTKPVFWKLMSGALEHELYGHATATEAFDNWSSLESVMSEPERFVYYDPRLLLQACALKITAITELIADADAVVECSMPEKIFKTRWYMTHAERANYLVTGSFDLPDLNSENFNEICGYGPLGILAGEVGESVAFEVAQCIRENLNNYVKILQLLLPLSREHPDSNQLSNLVQQVIEEVVHYHLDVHLDYCNTNCNFPVAGGVTQTISEQPLLVSGLLFSDVRMQAAAHLFAARALVTQPLGTPLVSQEEILQHYVDHRAIVAQFCEEHLLNQFTVTQDLQITQFGDFAGWSNYVLLSLAQLNKDYHAAPARLIHEGGQDLSAQWEAVQSLLPRIAENVVTLNESQVDVEEYRMALARVVSYILRGTADKTPNVFFSYAAQLEVEDPTIRTHIAELAPFYELYDFVEQQGLRMKLQTPLIHNLSEYVLQKTVPLVFAYQPETQEFDTEAFVVTDRYLSAISETPQVQEVFELVAASEGVASLIAEIGEDEFLEIAVAVTTAEEMSALFTRPLFNDAGQIYSLHYDTAKFEKAVSLVSSSLEKIMKALPSTINPTVQRVRAYIEEIQMSLEEVSLTQVSESFFSYLIYRTRCLMAGVLDPQTIEEHVMASSQAGTEFTFQRLGM